MSLTMGRYELILRSMQGAHKEYSIGEFTLDVRPGEGDSVDFYDVNRELEDALERVYEVPPVAGE